MTKMTSIDQALRDSLIPCLNRVTYPIRRETTAKSVSQSRTSASTSNATSRSQIWWTQMWISGIVPGQMSDADLGTVFGSKTNRTMGDVTKMCLLKTNGGVTRGMELLLSAGLNQTLRVSRCFQ